MKRHIDIKGTQNIRDIGGYLTRDGGTIKWSKVFRAGRLSGVDREATDDMEALNLSSIIDFRTLGEQESFPDYWHKLDSINRYSFPIGEGRMDGLNWMKDINYGDGSDHHLYKVNRSYVLREAQQFKDFFEVLLNEDSYPTLYHCTAGKDRTGFATFLLLTILGVDRSIIMEDYMLTNKYLQRFIDKNLDFFAQKVGVDKEKVRTMLIVKESYIQGALDAIDQDYGTVENFMKVKLNIGKVEIERLKSILVHS